jgi:hypothetical protein
MKSIFVIVGFLISVGCFGQCENTVLFDEGIFDHKLTKGTDTIYFEAKFGSIGKISQQHTLERLSKEKRIDISNYHTAIAFVPLGSERQFYLPVKIQDAQTEKLLNEYGRQSARHTICIKAIVFRGYEKVDSSPFFLIEKVTNRQ